MIDWSASPSPNRTAALERLAGVDPAKYARTRNFLDGAVTGLSPYLTHGLLTLREVLIALLSREPLAVDHKLVYEFGWREFFRHAWSHEGQGILRSLHSGPLPDDAYATELPFDIRRATTGVPVIDQAVGTLYRTGNLHNHARMWLASYVVHMRKVHWRVGADWLVAHLLDGDLASNHLSWQWVAGTGSHKPYLFNADNVARYAPSAWHSGGSVMDRSYEELERIARGERSLHNRSAQADLFDREGQAEPTLLSSPPPELSLRTPSAAAAQRLQGRDVWLVHPWALRAIPPGLPRETLVIGVYPREHFQLWPWPEARWRWVDTAMAELTTERWWVDASELAAALGWAASVRSVADPHVAHWLEPLARLDKEPTLFAPVAQRCRSFSQWWKRATRGAENAEDLL